MKVRSQFVCQQCGTTYAKWAGQCTNCQAWNSLVEQAIENTTGPKAALARGANSGKKLEFVKISTIIPSNRIRKAATRKELIPFPWPHNSAYVRQSFKYSSYRFPDFIKLRLDFFNIILIYVSGFISFLCNLVYIIAVDTKESDYLFYIREIQVDDISIPCHLSDISAPVLNPSQFHLGFYGLDVFRSHFDKDALAITYCHVTVPVRDAMICENVPKVLVSAHEADPEEIFSRHSR